MAHAISVCKANGTYEEELGVKINWVSFESGVKMSAAMASGDVQLSVSQGVPPSLLRPQRDKTCKFWMWL